MALRTDQNSRDMDQMGIQDRREYVGLKTSMPHKRRFKGVMSDVLIESMVPPKTYTLAVYKQLMRNRKKAIKQAKKDNKQGFFPV